MLRVLMPIALAAISSSRIAIQARPMRESSQAVADDDGDDHQHQEQVVVQVTGGSSMPNSDCGLAEVEAEDTCTGSIA